MALSNLNKDNIHRLFKMINLENIDNEKGNVEYDRYEHFWKNNKCIYCGASQKSYDRDQELETYAYPFIHLNDLNSYKNMKFDVIIGNFGDDTLYGESGNDRITDDQGANFIDGGEGDDKVEVTL